MTSDLPAAHPREQDSNPLSDIARSFYLQAQRTAIRLPSPFIVVLSFLLTILAGSLLLSLPFAHNGQLSLVDAIFTATSATCVTGLSVVDTGTRFTLFGQMVLVILMQVGGVGIMTCSVAVFHLLGRQICHRDRLVLKESFGIAELDSFWQLLKLIFGSALLIEAVGAIFLWISFGDISDPFRRLWSAVFHAVSAFCNGGFSLFSDSLIRYQSDWMVNLIVIALIFLGGIGFPTLFELIMFFRRRGTNRSRLSTQSKVIFTTTIFLIFFGTVTLFFIESDYALSSYSTAEKFLICFFQSVSSRTAGFNTFDLSQFSEASLLVIIGLMFIGAAPGSCAGGVKVTTVAVLYGFVSSKMQGFRRPTLFYRSISAKSITQSMSLLALAVIAITSSLFLFLIVHQSRDTESMFLPLLFESVSAFATVGLSLGATANFTTVEKLLTILLMFIGRVGIFSFSYLVLGLREEKRYEYAEDSLMIG